MAIFCSFIICTLKGIRRKSEIFRIMSDVAGSITEQEYFLRQSIIVL